MAPELMFSSPDKTVVLLRPDVEASIRHHKLFCDKTLGFPLAKLKTSKHFANPLYDTFIIAIGPISLDDSFLFAFVSTQ